MEQSHPTPVEQSFEKIVLFKDLPSESRERIRQHCRLLPPYDQGEAIVDKGDDAKEVFFVAEGAALVKIYSFDGKDVPFRDLGPGDIFGEYAAIDHSPRSARVEAGQGGCRVVSMEAEAFRKLLQTEPKVAEALLKLFVYELREMTKRVYEFSTLPVSKRIQAEVLRLARRVAPEGKEVRIFPTPTHEVIANRVGTHREAVTKELSRLAKIGIIGKQENKQKRALLVMDLDRLDAMIHEATGE